MWISSSDLNPIIDHEAILLGDGTVESVRRVDPDETFGLFSVQNYTVLESNTDCQVLKVSSDNKNLFPGCSLKY